MNFTNLRKQNTSKPITNSKIKTVVKKNGKTYITDNTEVVNNPINTSNTIIKSDFRGNAGTRSFMSDLRINSNTGGMNVSFNRKGGDVASNAVPAEETQTTKSDFRGNAATRSFMSDFGMKSNAGGINVSFYRKGNDIESNTTTATVTQDTTTTPDTTIATTTATVIPDTTVTPDTTTATTTATATPTATATTTATVAGNVHPTCHELNLVEDVKSYIAISRTNSEPGNVLMVLYDKIIINIAKNLMSIIESEKVFADIVLMDIHEWNRSNYKVEENYYFFVFLPHLLKQEVPYDRSSIYLMEQNLDEQLNTRYLHAMSNNIIFKHLLEQSNIFDYSQYNIDVWKKHVKPDISQNIKLLLPPVSKKIDMTTDKEYDVLFFGALNPRREKIINGLRQLNINVKIINYEKWGDDLINEIKKAKIVLNIHYYDNAILETPRISEVLPYAKIISEMPYNEDKSSYEKYKDAVDFVPVVSNIENIKTLAERIRNILDTIGKNNIHTKLTKIKKIKEINTTCDNVVTYISKAHELLDYNYFIVNNNTGGGSYKWQQDIETYIHLKRIWNYDKLCWLLKHHDTPDNIVLIINSLLFCSITVKQIVELYNEFKFSIVLPIHDWYWFHNTSGHTNKVHSCYLDEGLSLKSDEKALFDIAKKILCPSRFVYDIVNRHYSSSKVIQQNWLDYRLDSPVNQVKIEKYNTINIGVLSSLSECKGREQVSQLLKKYNHSEGVKIFIVRQNIEGYADNYDSFAAIIKKYNIHGLLYLNKWGETWCYSMTKGLLSGLPILYNNIGSFKERVPKNNDKYIINNNNESEYYDKQMLVKNVEKFIEYVVNNNIYLNQTKNIEDPEKNVEIIKLISSIDDSRKTLAIVNNFSYPGGGGEEFLYDYCLYMKKKDVRIVWIYTTDWNNNTPESNTNILFIKIDSFTKSLKKTLIKNRVNGVLHSGVGHAVIADISKSLCIPTITIWCFWEELLEIDPKYGITDILKHLDHHKKNDNFKKIISTVTNFYFASNFMQEIAEKKYNIKIKDSNILPALSINNRSKKDVSIDSFNSKYITIINCHNKKGGLLFAKLIEMNPEKYYFAINSENDAPTVELIKNNMRLSGHNENILINRTNNISDVYNNTKIIVCPTQLDETFCRVVFEAFQNKIPIIFSNKGNLKYLEGKDLLIVKDDNVTTYNKYIRLLQNKHYYENIIINQNKCLVEKDRIIKKFDEMHRELFEKQNVALKRIGIFTPWCDQGLGILSRIYKQILEDNGFVVAIFSSSPCAVQDSKKDRIEDNTEWDIKNIYRSKNDRFNVTLNEIDHFIKKFNTECMIIPEINNNCFNIAYYIRSKFRIPVYGIPMIECISKKDLSKCNVFDKILVNNNQTLRILNDHGLKNVEYLGFSYTKSSLVKYPVSNSELHIKDNIVKFLHITGLNGFTRKRTIEILETFTRLYETGHRNFFLTVIIQGNFINWAGDKIPLKKYSNTPNINIIRKHLSYSSIMQHYQENNVSIQISKNEGLGLGFYESCYLNTPVLSLNTQPHNEVIHHNKNGWLIDCWLENDKIKNATDTVQQTHFKMVDLFNMLINITTNIENTNKVILNTKKHLNEIHNIDKFTKRFINFVRSEI